MSDPFIGEIMLTGFDYAPQGWALCNGQLLPISQNQALFALLGTMYGGDGVTNFALPDLRGRVPIHKGQGKGLSNRQMGEVLGTESATLSTRNLPPHSHGLKVAAGQTTDRPSRDVAPAIGGVYGTPAADGGGTASEGDGTPFNIMQPSLVMNYVIALQGIFPSRD